VAILNGYTSANTNQTFAMTMAKYNLPKGKKPVLIHILWKGVGDYFLLDRPEISAYDTENEVLMNDGLKMKILKVNENYH